MSSMNPLYSSGFLANFVRESIEKPTELMNKLKRKPEKYNLLIREVFSDLSPNQGKGEKTPLEFIELNDFLETLKKNQVFSNAHYVTKNGFYILGSLEDACKKRNEVLAKALIGIGVPISLNSIAAAFQFELWDVVKEMYPKIVEIVKRGDPMPTHKMIFLIFNLKNQKVFLDLVDAGLPLRISQNNVTLTHIAAGRGFCALAKRLVDEGSADLSVGASSPLSCLGKENQDIASWLELFSILYKNRNFNGLHRDCIFNLILRYYRLIKYKDECEKKRGEEVLLIILQEIFRRMHPFRKKQILESVGPQNRTFLMIAAQCNFEKIGLFFFENEINFTAIDENGDDILLISIRDRLNALIETILKKVTLMPIDAKQEILERVGSAGLTPLLLALRRGNEKAAQKLIEMGANINAVDCDGWGSVHYALKGSLIKLLESEIKKGSWTFTRESLNYPEKGREQNNIGIACSIDKEWESVLWFLENGGKPDATNNEGKTIASFAARHGNVVVLEKIFELQKGAGFEKKSKNERRAVLKEALLSGQKDIVEWLIKKGAKKEKWNVVIDWEEDGACLESMELSTWKLLWNFIGEESRKTVRKEAFFIAFQKIMQDKDWNLVQFFLENDFSISRHKDCVLCQLFLEHDLSNHENQSLLNLIKNCPQELKGPILQKFFAEIREDKKRLESEEDFGLLFDEKIGDQTIQVKVGGQFFSFILATPILGARSEYFNKQFFRPMKEGLEILIHSEKALSDEKSKAYVMAFEKLFRFFYSKKIDVTCDNFIILGELANRYGFKDLKEILRGWLKDHPAFSSWDKYLNPSIDVVPKKKKSDELDRKSKRSKVEQ